MECLECFSPVCLLTRQIDEFSELREMKGKNIFSLLNFHLYPFSVRARCVLCVGDVHAKD